MWKLWKTSGWMHGVSYLPPLGESYLSDAGSTMDNSHFEALPQFHSFESVPLGWWWCTWPTWPSQLYRNESPLSELWGKVNLGGEPISIQSAGFSQGRKRCLLWFGTPLHMVSPPTDPSPFSSPFRHQAKTRSPGSNETALAVLS